jgi:ankyrin repeat protein
MQFKSSGSGSYAIIGCCLLRYSFGSFNSLKELGNHDIMQILLAAGVDVDYQNEHKATALHIAAERGKTRCIPC